MSNTKITVRNSTLLRTIKKENNDLIFKRASTLINSEGIKATIDFVLQFVREDLRASERIRLLSL